MKLSLELIFQHLFAKYHAKYAPSGDRLTAVGRPVFYEQGRDISGRICLIPPEAPMPHDLPAGVYLAVEGFFPDPPPADIGLITVPPGAAFPALFNGIQELFDYYEAWADEMDAIVEKDGGFAELVECAARRLRCRVWLLDGELGVVAASEPDASAPSCDEAALDSIPAGIASALLSVSDGGAQQDGDIIDFTADGNLFLSHSFTSGGAFSGMVVLRLDDGSPKDAYALLLRELARRISAVLKKRGAFSGQDSSSSPLREVVAGYLQGKHADSRLAERALGERGWSPADEYLLLRLQPELRLERRLRPQYLVPLIERQWPASCALEHGECVVVLLNKTACPEVASGDFYNELERFLSEIPVVAGISRAFRGLDRLGAHLKQAETAAKVGTEIAPEAHWYSFDEFALACWIRCGAMDFEPEQICSTALLSLIAHDRENGTEYYKTLKVFFRNRFNYTRAAAELFVHRTTLIKRLERIVEMTGLRFDDPDEVLYAELSFKYIDMFIGA